MIRSMIRKTAARGSALLLVGALALTSTACQEGEDSDTGLLLGLAALAASQFNLNFVATTGSTQVQCGSGNSYSIAGVSNARIQDLRFYAHNFRLVSGGTETSVSLTNDGVWQYNGVALIDFENASADCAGSSGGGATAATNTTIRGTAPIGSYSALRFTVGVPYELNHLQASSSNTPAPLNSSAMSWSWAGGRKFVKVEVTNGTNTATFHMGGQCSGIDPGPYTCTRSNRPEVELPILSGGAVRFDVGQLLAAWTLGANPACHSALGDPECVSAFTRLGVNEGTGVATASSQIVFSGM